MKSTEDYFDFVEGFGFNESENRAFVAGCRYMEPITTDHKFKTTPLSPKHSLVSNFRFSGDEEDEAVLADAIAWVAEKNGLTRNEVSQVFPLVLRILKSKSKWAE